MIEVGGEDNLATVDERQILPRIPIRKTSYTVMTRQSTLQQSQRAGLKC